MSSTREGRTSPFTTAGTIRSPGGMLQSGPGDYCRIAFQTIPKQHLYKIYYGGKGETGKTARLDQLGRPAARDPPLDEL